MDGAEGALFAVLGTAALVLFAAYARRQEPERARRAYPWIAGGLLITGAGLLVSALLS